MRRKDSRKTDQDAPKVKPLRIVCPKTSAPFTIECRNDTEWLAKHWRDAMTVRCPHCGGKHAYLVKNVYLSEAIADRQASPDLFAA